MPRSTPLSIEARAAGHRLYQTLYGPVSEQVPFLLDQVQAVIDQFVSSTVSDDDIIRAALAEADFRYLEAYDDDSAQAYLDVEDVIFEPSARMSTNAAVESLLENARMAREAIESAKWDAKMAEWEAQSAKWDAEAAEHEAHMARQAIESAKWEAQMTKWAAEEAARQNSQQ